MRDEDQRNKKMSRSKSKTYRKNKGGSPRELPPIIVRCLAAAIPRYEKIICSVGKLTLRFSFTGNRVWEGL